MRVGYLIAQYPKTSHTFIRREIAALERLGIVIQRYSARRVSEPLVDPDDQAESKLTRVILESGAFVLLGHTLAVALRRPVLWIRALATAVQMGWRSDRGLVTNLVYVCEACTLVRWMKADNVEHLHAHFGTNATAIALLAHKLGGPPYSFTVHGPEVQDIGVPLSLKRKIHEARFVVAISYHARAYLMRFSSRKDWGKIPVIHCGLDSLYLDHPVTPLPEEPRLICVARLDTEKAHFVLLEAAAQLAQEGLAFELELIGDGPLRPDIEESIKRLGLHERVRLSGWLSSHEVLHRLISSRLMVLPSLSEGLPVVFMEALASGRPVITTYIAGIPELIVDQENGWLVPASHVGALTCAMREALTASTAELTRMGTSGRRRVIEQHNVNVEATRLAEMFHSVRQTADRQCA